MDNFSNFYSLHVDRSLTMSNALYVHLKELEKLCLVQQMDPNVYSCQLSRALILISLCVVEADCFKYNFDVYNARRTY